jgi:hypothetical protein
LFKLEPTQCSTTIEKVLNVEIKSGGWGEGVRASILESLNISLVEQDFACITINLAADKSEKSLNE